MAPGKLYTVHGIDGLATRLGGCNISVTVAPGELYTVHGSGRPGINGLATRLGGSNIP